MSLGIGQIAPNASGQLPDHSTFTVHGLALNFFAFSAGSALSVPNS